MNHGFFGTQRTGIQAIAVRFPTTWDPEAWHMSGRAGTDFITPMSGFRWDITEWYDPADDGWKAGKSFVLHGGFMDGAELFDNRLFGLSAAESKSMDPCQRLVLECGYDAL